MFVPVLLKSSFYHWEKKLNDFIEIIRTNAIKYPERIAVIERNRKINYADFFNLVLSISHQLRKINHNPKVVFDLDQSIDAYALIIAVLNVGGTFCPLNTASPIERKIQIINEFQPHVVVVSSDDNNINYDKASTTTIAKLASKGNFAPIEENYNAESIIYVIYTSGSTGAPKGVMICRKALNKFLEWSIPTYNAGESDIWGQFSLLSFDLSIVDIFTCLCSGATLLVLADKTSKWVPSSAIENNKITIWHSIPSAIDFMIEREKSREADLSSLRLMSFCGEPLRKHHLDFLFGKNNNLSIFNTYGPTEGTLFCTYQNFSINDYLNYCAPTMSIGKPIPGWNFSFNPTEEPSLKEVVIYGDYIGIGYLGKVEDAKFRIIEVEGKRVKAFETGDLVTENNGNLFFSCRKDRQIKFKGYRIEPDEIDFWNTEYFHNPSVTIYHNNALYSFIETDQDIDEKGIRCFLEKNIELFKIPRTFISVKKYPRSSNFKVNYSELAKLIT